MGWAWTYLVVAELSPPIPVWVRDSQGAAVPADRQDLRGNTLIGAIGLAMDQAFRALHRRAFPGCTRNDLDDDQGKGHRHRRVEQKYSRLPSGSTVALHDIDLEIAPNEFVTLVGASGCGKSTLLRIGGPRAAIGRRGACRWRAGSRPRRGSGDGVQHYSLYPGSR